MCNAVSMCLNARTQLHKLCSRALRETDPEKLAILLRQINEILCETLAELQGMLKDVEQVLSRRRPSSRIDLT